MTGNAARYYAAVGLGSALGAVARHLCSVGLLAALGPQLPWGTLAVNVLGSFLIGLHAAMTVNDGRYPAGPLARPFFQAGFCGGFTTFSIFSLETVLMVGDGAIATAGLYAAISASLWLAGVAAGHRAGAVLNRVGRA